MEKLLTCLVLITGLIIPFAGKSQAYTENFDDITTLTGNGWFMQNNSSPVGSNWFQGIATTANPEPFISYNGAVNSYIAANFSSTGGGIGTISNWLITPNRTIRNGDVFTFYTRKPTISSGQTDYPDRLEVRMSTNGASTNAGADAGETGDFSTLLLSINPTLVADVYPQVWTKYTITISGLPAPTSGRIAFRYFVTSAGSLGSNSDYIGIDNVVYTPYTCPAFTMTTGGMLTGGVAGSSYSASLAQTGALGTPNFAITAGALPPGVTLATNGTISGTPTATGTFNFTVTVSDASGCSGAQSYSITVVCPANPITLAASPALCDNGSAYTLIEGSPAGGTYNGTGVTAGQFDPSSGSQAITYDYTDPYGCVYSSNYTITVNTAPTVTQSAISVCDNSGTFVLIGGLPAGGVYSGTGVTAGEFDPSAGTQTITYTYTDANGCVNEATETVIVNVVPDVAVTLSGTTLTVTQTSAAYQWIDCENNPIAGATNQSFTATVNGDYAVIIENEYGCADTSACYNINTVGIKSLEQNEWSMYPNPSAGNIHIRSSVSGNFTVINNLGQELIRFDVQAGIENIVSLIHLPDGVYFIKGTESAVSTIAQKLIIRK